VGLTERLARASSRHPWRTIAGWVIALVVAFGATAAFLGGGLTTEGGAAGNVEFRKFNRAAHRAFPPDPKRATSEIVVVRSERYTVDDPQYRSFVTDAVAKARREKAASNALIYYRTRNPSLISSDEHAMAIPLLTDEDHIADLLTVVEDADANPNFAVSITGDETSDHDFNELSQHDLKTGELQFGLPAALVVLVLVFGAVVAGLIPLLMALASIFVGLGLVALLTQAWELSVFVVNMLTGMGLALGIDYSLFVVSRYREERAAGRHELDAIGGAGATASRAVLFSGTAFVVAMFGMLLVPNSIMRSLAAGAILVGAVSVVAALTLLPALLGLLGDRVNALRIPLIGSAAVEAADPEGKVWRKIVTGVLRRPALSLALAVAVLVAAAVPVFGLNSGTSGIDALPDRFVAKRGFEALQRDFPETRIDPAEIVVTSGAPRPEISAKVEQLRAYIEADNRFTTSQVMRSRNGQAALVTAPLRSDPASDDAVAAVRKLRDEVVPTVFGDTDTQVYVGGQTSENVDYLDSVTNPAPIVFVFVLGLTFILLTIVFRSIVIAATAVVLNLLSVGAAYGLLVLVFQHGVGAGLFGFTQFDTIEAWVPLFLFSVLFGLSMDYQVFLLSRIKERYDLNPDTSAAVQHGVASTARIITGAALIIVVVFIGFAMGDLIMFQQMGFGIAVALLIDATIIRSVILPSAMHLLGRWNWYLPSWLEWLPHLEVEGHVEAPPAPRPAAR
jgi:putative drug exporter of the RND superfamily